MYNIVFNGGTSRESNYMKPLWSNVVDAVIKVMMNAIKNRVPTVIDVYDAENVCIVHLEC